MNLEREKGSGESFDYQSRCPLEEWDVPWQVRLFLSFAENFNCRYDCIIDEELSPFFRVDPTANVQGHELLAVETIRFVKRNRWGCTWLHVVGGAVVYLSVCSVYDPFSITVWVGSAVDDVRWAVVADDACVGRERIDPTSYVFDEPFGHSPGVYLVW